MPKPFNGQLFDFTQPDGTLIRLRGWGNQYHAVFETPDGYTVTRDPVTGAYEVAQLSADGLALEPAVARSGALNGRVVGQPRGLRVRRESSAAAARDAALQQAGRRCEQRRQERRERLRAMRSMAAAGGPLLAPPQRQTVGDFIGLCLLIDFADAPATIARDEVERFCNEPGYNGFGNHGSVFDFFRDNSIGRCRYTNVVAPYYRALQPKTYYTDATVAQPRRALELINEALAHHKANGFDFSRLTTDTQGFVYAMSVYYAGPVTNNWAEGLWPHAHHLGSPALLLPGRSVFDYQFTAMGAELELGTFCHENGHMLCDYPDLYDYGYESSGVGDFCLMCSGNNANEKNPVQVSAYLKRMSGWARNVTVLEHDRQVSLDAGSNDMAIFSRGGREYFLIENRQRTGRDAALPGSGLAIWHIDEDGDNSHEHMTGANHYELSLEQADGQFQLERLARQTGDAVDLYAGAAARFADNSVPSSKWWNGTASNLVIDQISLAGATMTFRSRIGETAAPLQTIARASTPNLAIPDNDAAGISDTIEVTESLTIASIRIGVDISHSYRADLRVTLTTPWRTVIELHPKGQGGDADNLKLSYDENSLPALATLRGRSTQGTWRLTVRDLAPADNGRLNRWSIDVAAGAAVAGPIDLSEAPGAPIPDHPNAGIERTLTTATALDVGSVELSVDIAHSWIGDLQIRLVSPAGTVVTVHDRADRDMQNLVRTYTTATASALAALHGPTPAGAWRLQIVDTAADDAGKLNRWRLVVRPAV